MELLDKNGKPVQVDDAEATKAFASGQYGVRGKVVNVRNNEGVLGTVPASQLQAAIQQGYELVSPEEAQKEILQREYGGVGGAAVTAGEGLVSGATAGLSDAAAIAIGGDAVREHIEKHRLANPTTSFVSQAIGTVAPLLATGGAAAPELAAGELGAEGLTAGRALGAGVRAIGAPIRAIDAAGTVAERAAAALVGEGSENALARVAQKAIATGARGATEGALFGVGQAIGDSAIEDHELTAEKLFASIGHSALYGLVGGAAFGAGGEVLGTGAKALARHMSPALREVAETQAWKSLIPAGSMKAATREAERIPGGARGVARQLLDDGIIAAGDSVADIAPRISAARTAAGERVGELLEEATTAGAKISTSKVAQRVERDVLRELETMPNLNKPAIAKVRAFLDDMIVSLGDETSLTGLRDFRRRVESVTKYDVAADNATNAAMKQLRASLEDELIKTGDEAASKMGRDWASAYKEAKLRFQRLAVADKAAEQSVVAQSLSNNSVGLRDTIMAGSTAAGAIASGHPLGLLASIATGAASKVARERGSATVASVMDKLADMSAVRQVSERLDSRTTAAVRDFVKGGATNAAQASNENLGDQFSDAVKRVRAASSNPAQQAAAVDNHLSTIALTAPKVANAFRMAAVRATGYLATKIPPSANKRYDTLQPQLERPRASDAEMASFMRSYRAVDDPESVLKDMQRGKVTSEQIEALRVVYPKLYTQLQSKAIQYISEKKGRLTYQQETQLGIMLGFPTNDSLKPESIRTYQSSFQGSSSSSQGQARPAPSAPKRMIKGFDDGVSLKTRS